MPLNKFFRIPFAESGDKTAVPDATQGDGSVSYNQGYGPDYQLPKTNPAAKDIPRNSDNQLKYDVTKALQEYQTNGVPDWITAAQNGGTAYPYPIGARVRYTDNVVYISQVAANTATPGASTNWAVDSGRLLAVRVFSTPGATAYTPTVGTKAIEVFVVGGGGGGGGTSATGASQHAAGGGGGGGGWARVYLTSGLTQTLTVGAAGTGGAIGANGGSGGASSFGSLAVANGGSGGSLGPLEPTSSGTVNRGSGGVGGTSTGGEDRGQGGQGFSGWYFGTEPGNTRGGTGGVSAMGAGTGESGGVPGVASPNRGAGGGGAGATVSTAGRTGGAGGAGIVVVKEYA